MTDNNQLSLQSERNKRDFSHLQNQTSKSFVIEVWTANIRKRFVFAKKERKKNEGYD